MRQINFVNADVLRMAESLDSMQEKVRDDDSHANARRVGLLRASSALRLAYAELITLSELPLEPKEKK